MKIVVIGGTGLIGSKSVAILRQGGHEVIAASPKVGVNTICRRWAEGSPGRRPRGD
jgi:nucleoside-diphosphate-sugar epimerase